MPELAEVETVKRILKKEILFKKIIDIKVYYPKIIINDLSPLINDEFINILRKGKYLIFESHHYYLISHLRMEGKYFIKDNNDIKDKHEHLKIIFNDLSSLRYNDTRKFGRLELIEKENLTAYFSKLGLEPDEVTVTYLKDKLKNHHKDIKTLLLDQSIIAGLGNIYASEVLFASNINPYKEGSKLSDFEIEKLILNSRHILNEAIKYGGTTIRSYTSSLGKPGEYQNYLKVFKKENELCPHCHQKIVKVKISGRSTYYCPNCQK